MAACPEESDKLKRSDDNVEKGGEYMSEEQLENQLRGYSAIIGALRGLTKETCVNCVSLDGARIKVGKELAKLSKDLETMAISSETTKANFKGKIDALAKDAEGLQIADDVSCQKTAGTCKMGEKCLASGAVELLNLIPPV